LTSSRRFLISVAAAVGMLVAVPAAASAATIEPNILTDEDTNNSSCSLREAITAAQTDGDYNGCLASVNEDADTIVLQSGQTYTLSLADSGDEHSNANGDLDVNGQVGDQTLTIQASGSAPATIDGNGAVTHDRVFELGANGGGSFIGSVTLSNLVITGGQGVDGGGIRTNSSGLLTITGSSVSGNSVNTGGIGGAMRLDGGATQITDSTIAGNNAPSVGGIWTEVSNLTIDGSTIVGNQATDPDSPVNGNGPGGGVLVNPAGTATISNSTITGNSSKVDGGGIYNFGTLTLRNSTISGNTADGDAGSTGGDGGGIFIDPTAVATDVSNTIIAGNSDLSPTGNVYPDCSGTLVASYDLIQDGTGCNLGVGSANNLPFGTDPLLAGLADNGGPTKTERPQPVSPAVNAGDPAAPGGAAPACVATDQRGVTRGGDTGICDIGAYEDQPVTLDPIGSKVVQAGQTLSFAVAGNDPDPADALTYALGNQPAGASLNSSTGQFAWTPSAAQAGTFPNVHFTASDGFFTDAENVTITVTPVPVTPVGGTPTKKKCKKHKKHKRSAAASKKCKKKKKKRG
jgi:CSLREA domain-containing protein